MDKREFNVKINGNRLQASEWNDLVEYVGQAVDEINNITSLPNLYINSKGNLNLETSTLFNGTSGETSKGKINIESISDIQLKPGDDISLYSHHRGNQDELSIKVLNGSEISSTDNTEISEYPVDLQFNVANVVLSTKDKNVYVSEKNKARLAEGKEETPDKKNILNLEIKTGVKSKNATQDNSQYGYLKVRSSAIDLRCEDHGGIALQPKGYDESGHMNKIKFEHGGGDGLEFGTFNTEKTSIFTNEYRFNKDGKVLLATREMIDSGKTDDGVFDQTPSGSEATNAKKYVKQSDDFYDIIYGTEAEQNITWGDIVKFIAWAKTNNQGPWQL